MSNLAHLWPGVHPVARRVQDHFLERDGLRLHYVSLGEGPLVVLIHGIPEFWYSWRHQIEPLAQAGFQVLALDQRGFNQSGQPATPEGYHVRHLVEDVAAIIRAHSHGQAAIVGHDSGAFVAWHFAAAYPHMTTSLVTLSVPHPNAFREELAQNPAQHNAGSYARKMQKPDAQPAFRIGPVGVLRDPAAAPLYLAAEGSSDPQAITAFYQLNYPRPPYELDPALTEPVAAPTLVLHGQKDTYLLASGHARNAKWLRHAPQIEMLDAGHFIQQEAPHQVNTLLVNWLQQHA